jgi:hypothetical protein
LRAAGGTAGSSQRDSAAAGLHQPDEKHHQLKQRAGYCGSPSFEIGAQNLGTFACSNDSPRSLRAYVILLASAAKPVAF